MPMPGARVAVGAGVGAGVGVGVPDRPSEIGESPVWESAQMATPPRMTRISAAPINTGLSGDDERAGGWPYPGGNCVGAYGSWYGCCWPYPC
jgi:hypothetical protein